MKTFNALVVVLFALVGLRDVKAAVTVQSNPTQEEFAQAYGVDGLFSWSVTFETGYPTNGTPEIRAITNRLNVRDHLWSTPDQIGVDYDASGNLNIRAGSTSFSVQPTVAFNTLLLRLGDRTRFSTYTEFKNINFDTLALRNMFADDLGTSVTTNDYQIIRGVEDEFSLTGNFFKSIASNGNESQLEITGVWIIPEPTSFLMILFSASLFFIRRRL